MFVYIVTKLNEDSIEPSHKYHKAEVEVPSYEAQAIQHGKWQYVHRNGFICNVCGQVFHPFPGSLTLKER